MKLLNLELSSPSFSIELIGLGFVWDLHNSGRFLGVHLNANDNTATMKWLVNGHPSTKYSGCDLVFRNLKLMIVSRDNQLPLSEDTCISGISKIVPDAGARAAKYRTKAEWDATDPFNLLFEFQSGRSIEKDADTVELIGVTKSA